MGGGMMDDTMGGGTMDDTMGGGMMDDTMGGGTMDDTMGGGTMDDTMGGGTMDDTMGGGTMDDTMGGGTMDDDMSSGSDTVTFSVTNFVGSSAEATVTLTETADGIEVTVEATNPMEDLRGVFFNIADDSLLDSLVISGTDVTDSVVGPAGSVNMVNGDPSISPRAFDVGVEIGTPGPAPDEILSTTFLISGLTLDDFADQDFGVRTQDGKLAGTAPDDIGVPGDDTMPGGGGDDTMPGGGGDDTMPGGGGDDTMPGGGGDDDDSDDLDSIIGTSFGQFSEPEDANGAVFEISDDNGGVENRFEWGVPVSDSFSNIVQFDGSDFGAEVGEQFKIGQLFYRNGTTNSNFNGDFGFSLELDIAGLDNDPEPFEFSFNILNTPNTTGSPVEDGDRLRFSTGGLAPQTFAFNGKTFTVELDGFSTDGGETIQGGFDAPEESFQIANLYGKITQLSDDTAGSFDPLPGDEVDDINDGGGVFVGGDGTGDGAVAGSVIITSTTQLTVVWGITTSADIAFANGDFTDLPAEGGETDLDDLDDNVVSGSDNDDDVSGTDDNDVVASNGGNDEIDGEGGNDVIAAGDGEDTVMGGDDSDVINGNTDDDTLMGGDGSDVINGGQGNDQMMGEDGDDVLIGDMGADQMMGGDGDDAFIFRVETSMETTSSQEADWILDFQSGDRIGITASFSSSVELIVEDVNADGVDDVSIRFESSLYLGVVLNTSDTSAVQQAIFDVPDAEYLVDIG